MPTGTCTPGGTLTELADDRNATTGEPDGGAVRPCSAWRGRPRTRLWNDSATPAELSAAIGWGAVGATCNPVIALAALRSDLPRWRQPDPGVRRRAPHRVGVRHRLGDGEELSIEAAALLTDAFTEHRGRNGRLSVQTDPRLYRDSDALAAQAVEFDALAPNVIVKIPATENGIRAMEEATYRGVSINATVSFTVPQAVAVAEAIERGLQRREAEGHDVGAMGPVCTIMVGRLDDWLKSVAKRDVVTVDPGVLEWAGVAVFKRAYEVFRERGFRTRLLSAAFRNHMHWSQLVGGDVVISPPFEWQVRLNASGIEPVPRIDEPVAAAVLDTLSREFPDFRRAYDPDGMTPRRVPGVRRDPQDAAPVPGACAELEGARPRRAAARPGEVARPTASPRAARRRGGRQGPSHEQDGLDDVAGLGVGGGPVDLVQPVVGDQPVEGQQAAPVQVPQPRDGARRGAVALQDAAHGEPLGHRLQHRDAAATPGAARADVGAGAQRVQRPHRLVSTSGTPVVSNANSTPAAAGGLPDRLDRVDVGAGRPGGWRRTRRPARAGTRGG